MAGESYFYASCSVGLVSLVLYIATCTTILKNRKVFASSYYKLYIFSSIVNVVTYWNSVLALRLPALTCFTCFWAPIFNFLGDSFPVRFLAIGIGYYGFLQYTISSLMALNRFTAVYFPFKHAQFWSRCFVPFIIFTVFYPLIFQYEYFIYSSELHKLNETLVYALKADVPVETNNYRQISLFSVCFGAFLLNVTLNAMVLFKIVYKRKHVLKQKGGKDELRLVLHNLVSFIGEAFASIVTFILLFRDNATLLALALSLVPPACDTVSLVSPIILLFCNFEIRSRLIGSCGRSEDTRVVSISNNMFQ